MKPVIRTIKISEKKLQELKEILDSSYSSGMKRKALKDIVGGAACCVCAAIPTKKVSYDVSDAVDGPGKRVERYCDKCYDKWVVEQKKKEKNKR